MAYLNAFVGHSFATEDELVVQKLLKVLDSVKNLLPGFDWDQAEAAEPQTLSAKVREKMKGKNLFIGICTARERTIPLNALSPYWLQPKSKLIVERASLQTKTPDWIIQEIGYALGCNMHLILLLENGVRPPGGLQGDLEYIPFERDAPEKCLPKLSSMLGKLSPKPQPAAEAPEKPAASAPAEAPSTDDLFFQTYLTPDPTWSADRYVQRVRFAIFMEKPEFEEKIGNAFRISPFYGDEQCRVTFEAATISERARIYQEDWITPLQKLVAEHPTNAGPYVALGERYAAANEFEGAALNYERAATHSESPQ
jgi:hypothetical protein